MIVKQVKKIQNVIIVSLKETLIPYCDDLEAKDKKIITYTMLEKIINDDISDETDQIAACGLLCASFNINGSSEWYQHFALSAEALGDNLSLKCLNKHSLFIHHYE